MRIDPQRPNQLLIPFYPCSTDYHQYSMLPPHLNYIFPPEIPLQMNYLNVCFLSPFRFKQLCAKDVTLG